MIKGFIAKGAIIALFSLLSIVIIVAYASPSQALHRNVQEYFTGRAKLSHSFNEKEASHLKDVKSLMWKLHYLWITTGILALMVASRESLRWAGNILVGLAVVLGICGSFFNSIFTGFHRLFFAAGGWTFHSDSLIIQVFPMSYFISSYFIITGTTLIVGLLLLKLSPSKEKIAPIK